jgi:MFS transporter, UMF1 family
VWAWCLYDWANSAFPTVIQTFVFSAYFAQAVAASPNEGTAAWGFMNTLAAFAIAGLSPILGAIADAGGPRKPWLAAGTALCALASVMLWFARPDPAFVWVALLFAGIATVAFELATVFYNAMLPELAPRARWGRVSGWGWGVGYLGGLACLAVALFVLVQPDPPLFGLDKASLEHVRAVGPLAGLWFALFALPLFALVPDRAPRNLGMRVAMAQGLAKLKRGLASLRPKSDVARFLLAHMLYTDGLNTLFAFGGIFAAGTFGMRTDEVILFGIALNVTAGLGAIAFGWVDDWIGARRTILIALAGIALVGALMLLAEGKTAFWALGMTLAIFFGPAQAASRSLMARLAPKDLETEMFGLFALSGKVTAFLGPALVGAATLAFDSQRAGMATVLPFVVLGGLVLLLVREPRGSN